MVKHQRTDLAYGILVRRIPRRCDALVARVMDVGGNIATSDVVAVPDQAPVDEFVDFEDGQLPPAGWVTVTSTGGSGTEVSIAASAAHRGTKGLRCVDQSTAEAGTQRAGIEYALPAGRFEWRAEGWFNPVALEPFGITPAGGLPPVFPRRRRSLRGGAHPERRGHAAARARGEEPGRSASATTTGRASLRSGSGAGGGWSCSGWPAARRRPCCLSTRAGDG